MSRLSLSPDCADLEPLVTAAPDTVRVQTGWAVAQWAIRHNNLSHPALAGATLGVPSEPIAAVVEALDNHYFELQELLEEEGEGSRADVLAAFRRALAATALEFGVRGEAEEAVYEALGSTEDVPAVRQVVMGSLG